MRVPTTHLHLHPGDHDVQPGLPEQLVQRVPRPERAVGGHETHPGHELPRGPVGPRLGRRRARGRPAPERPGLLHAGMPEGVVVRAVPGEVPLHARDADAVGVREPRVETEGRPPRAVRGGQDPGGVVEALTEERVLEAGVPPVHVGVGAVHVEVGLPDPDHVADAFGHHATGEEVQHVEAVPGRAVRRGAHRTGPHLRSELPRVRVARRERSLPGPGRRLRRGLGAHRGGGVEAPLHLVVRRVEVHLLVAQQRVAHPGDEVPAADVGGLHRRPQGDRPQRAGVTVGHTGKLQAVRTGDVDADDRDGVVGVPAVHGEPHPGGDNVDAGFDAEEGQVQGVPRTHGAVGGDRPRLGHEAALHPVDVRR